MGANLLVLVKLSNTDYRIKYLSFNSDTELQNIYPEVSNINLSDIASSLGSGGGCGTTITSATMNFMNDRIIFTSNNPGDKNCIIVMPTTGSDIVNMASLILEEPAIWGPINSISLDQYNPFISSYNYSDFYYVTNSSITYLSVTPDGVVEPNRYRLIGSFGATIPSSRKSKILVGQSYYLTIKDNKLLMLLKDENIRNATGYAPITLDENP